MYGSYPAAFWNLLKRMLALEPSARPPPREALDTLTSIITESDREASTHTPVASGTAATGGTVAEARARGSRLDVQVRSVSGASAVVTVPADSTVGMLKAQAASVLEPAKARGDHTFLLLCAGHKLDDHLDVKPLMQGSDTCFHLVAIKASGVCGRVCVAVCVWPCVCGRVCGRVAVYAFAGSVSSLNISS